MPEEFDDTQATEESSQSGSEMPSEGSQDALESTEEQETVDSSSEASDASEEPSEAQNEASHEPTEEELGNMSDEEFLEYVNSGKMPQRKEQEPAEAPKEPSQEKVQKPVQNAEQPQINYEEVVKQIFAPFKANGKEIAPRTVEDVVQLMQMGANYTKKMQSIAPMRKAVESLSNAGIDSEEKLSYLIDLYKGDKEAIKQLLKNNQIDAMDLDLDEVNYNPNKQNIASDADVKFAETLSNINESLPQIQNIMDKQWDAESKRILLSDPRALQALHEEIQMGRFDGRLKPSSRPVRAAEPSSTVFCSRPRINLLMAHSKTTQAMTLVRHTMAEPSPKNQNDTSSAGSKAMMTPYMLRSTLSLPCA